MGSVFKNGQLQKYLPSSQFTLIAVALLLSVSLVFAADYVTKPKSVTSAVATVATSTTAQNTSWEATLYDIQAQQGVGSLPPAPDQNAVAALRQAVQTSSLTDSVGRSILINLANAKAQGLGDDTPTQTQIINEATAQLKKNTSPAYANSDLTVVADSTSTLRAYGNALVLNLTKDIKNSADQTTYAAGYAADHNSDSELVKLKSVEAAYRTLVKDLLALPVPQTLAPFHLLIINDFAQMADTYPDLETLVSDPLRGLVGLQRYQLLGDEVDRVFINIAQAFSKDGILFSNQEPGHAWSAVLSSQ